MSVDPETIMAVPFPGHRTRASAEQELADAKAVLGLMQLPGWKVLADTALTSAHNARKRLLGHEAEEFEAAQRDIHANELLLTLASEMIQDGMDAQKFLRREVVVPVPSMGKSPTTDGIKDARRRARVAEEMVAHAGWAPFMRRWAARAGAEAAALETCDAEDRGRHQSALQALWRPIAALQGMLRLGLAAEAVVAKDRSVEEHGERGV